jgi:hypothetical protein
MTVRKIQKMGAEDLGGVGGGRHGERGSERDYVRERGEGIEIKCIFFSPMA